MDPTENSQGQDLRLQLAKQNSVFRKSTYYTDIPDTSNPEDRKKLIIKRRGCFKWMPVLFSNDLVHGSWYYVAGSVLATIIPCFPLISLYQVYSSKVKFWHLPGYLPLADNTAAYGLLIFMGVLYSIGSWVFLRAVDEPHRPPLLANWYHFQNDELLAMWLMTMGTLPSVPLMILYVAYNPHNGGFAIALVVCIISTIACLLLTYACYPGKIPIEDRKPTKVVHYMICACLCKKSCYGYHFANDWLIACWMIVTGSVLATVATLVLLLVSIAELDSRGIFDYSTGLVDVILFLIGSMYFTAGSYEESNTVELNEVVPSSVDAVQRVEDP